MTEESYFSFESEDAAEADADWIALLKFLGDVAADLLEVEDLDRIPEILDATVERIIDVQYPGLYLYNEDEEALELIWSQGFTDEERRIAEESAMERHPGRVYREAEGFYVPDVQNDPENRTQDTPRRAEVRSRLYHPVVTQGESVGAFAFAASEPHAFDQEHIAALGFYSHLIGAAYGRLRRERQLRETRRRIESTNETLRAIREISQLMVREREVDRILQASCELLIETSAYEYAAIVGRDEQAGPTLEMAAPSSLDAERFDQIAGSDVAADLRELLEGNAGYFSRPTDGPGALEGARRAVGTSLEYAGIVHGVLLLGSSHREADPQEQTLLEGVANDIAFVSHMLGEESEDDSIAEQALRDWLTDLPNRALFRNRLSQSIARAERHERPFALLLLDLDNLKEINDSLGHAAGDRLLVRVGERLVDVLRDYDTVARVGGDEFTVILEGVESDEILEKVLTRIERALDVPFQIYGETFHSSASIGALMYSELKEQFESARLEDDELLRAVDRAMYRAKELPGTQWARPESEDLRSGEHIQKSNRLRRAIDDGRMIPHYQPIVGLESEEVVAVEALARWKLPSGETRCAGDFLETAERMARLWDVSRQVYRRAFRDLERWREEMNSDIALFLNLSPSGFERHAMFALFEEFDIPASKVVFEITEQDLLRNPDRIQALLERSFRVAIDDFGTGYSSFEYLKRFDVDCLKVDMAYVQGAVDDDTDRAILETICGLGRKLGIRVIGEGVEKEPQREQLVEFECGHAQGYLFGYPAAAFEVEKRLFGRPLAPAEAPEEDPSPSS